MASIYLGSPGSYAKPMELLDWVWLCAYAYKSVALLLAGCLLFARRARALRAAQMALFAAALGCLLYGVLMVYVTDLAFRSTAEQGPLAIFITGPMFVMSAFWTVITMITALKLSRYLKKPQRDESRQ
jgi:FtsH-binding integral membrane protein